MRKANMERGVILGLVMLVGCAHFPTTTRIIAAPPNKSSDVILEAAIDVAREMKFPEVTKMDKANGVVEFGAFGMPVSGTTAQVRVRADGQLDVTVKRGSVYVPLPVDEIADKFKAALESRLKGLK